MRGIYAIICWVEGMLYVGHSTNIRSRRKGHTSDLNCNRRMNGDLQDAWNKHGEDAFEFITLREMPGASVEELVEAEGELIWLYVDHVYNDNLYPDLPPSMTPEIAAKIGAANRGKKRSAETRAKISASKLGVPKSPEHRAKISAGLKGKTLSPETRAKISVANQGKKRGPMSQAHKDKISASCVGRPAPNKGAKHSPETKIKMSKAKKGKPWSEARRCAHEVSR